MDIRKHSEPSFYYGSLFLYNKLDICKHIALLYLTYCKVIALRNVSYNTQKGIITCLLCHNFLNIRDIILHEKLEKFMQIDTFY